MSPGDVLPSNRREVVMALACVCLGVGASMVPGVTFEPAEATEMRSELATCRATLEAREASLEECIHARRRGWCMYGACQRGTEPDCDGG